MGLIWFVLHSDVSNKYNKKPTNTIDVLKRSIKNDVELVGGDNQRTNMELAWETLDDEIKNNVKDKKAVHSSFIDDLS